jgi:hypothetical protein
MKRGWIDNLVGIALACLCVAAFVQCGNGGAKKTLVFTQSPNPSIVIESDYINIIYTSTGTIKETFKGPWAYWKYEVTNVSSATITVFAIKYEVYARDKKIEGDLTGAQYRTPQDYLFTLAPGASFDDSWVLPGLQTREEIGTLNYYFRAKAVGWYGSPTEPEKSFKSSFSFRAAE